MNTFVVGSKIHLVSHKFMVGQQPMDSKYFD